MGKNWIGAVGLMVALVAFATACIGSGASDGGDALAGTAWSLVLLDGSAPIEGTEITLAFEDGEVGGSTGCNIYGGSYTATADTLRLDGVYATERACLGIEGVMAQERDYLDALSGAATYRVDDRGLEIHNGTGRTVLVFGVPGAVGQETATPLPATPEPTSTATSVQEPTPTAVPPSVRPTVVPTVPAGWMRYTEPDSGVSLLLPDTWTFDAPGATGEVTILQSFPKDKYVGGEPFKPGDTKCDLWIHPPDTDADVLIGQYDTDPNVTVVSREEVVLASGEVGTRIEAEAMGRSVSLIADFRGQAVTFVCYGDLTPFDEIAVTLTRSE